MTRYEVLVDRDLCIGYGVCADLLPSVFALDEEGKATVQGEVTGPPTRLRDAAEACPVRAITLIDGRSRLRLYPDD